jgi:hypothetical protein
MFFVDTKNPTKFIRGSVSQKSGLDKLKKLSDIIGVHALFVEEPINFMAISKSSLAFLIRETFLSWQYCLELHDIGIPKLFYNFVFESETNVLDEHETFYYVVSECKHLKETFEKNLIIDDTFELITAKELYGEFPNVELYTTMFNIQLKHSAVLFSKFYNQDHPNTFLEIYENMFNQRIPCTFFYPNAFLDRRRYNEPSTEQRIELFKEWKRMTIDYVNLSYKIYENCSSYIDNLLTLNATVYESECTCNLMYLKVFVDWVFQSLAYDISPYDFIQDIDTIMDLINILRKYDYIPSVANLLQDNEESIVYFEKLCLDREELRKLYQNY